jgi:hypothetical protein
MQDDDAPDMAAPDLARAVEEAGAAFARVVAQASYRNRQCCVAARDRAGAAEDRRGRHVGIAGLAATVCAPPWIVIGGSMRCGRISGGGT